jgi:hypothetical protein
MTLAASGTQTVTKQDPDAKYDRALLATVSGGAMAFGGIATTTNARHVDSSYFCAAA